MNNKKNSNYLFSHSISAPVTSSLPHQHTHSTLSTISDVHIVFSKCNFQTNLHQHLHYNNYLKSNPLILLLDSHQSPSCFLLPSMSTFIIISSQTPSILCLYPCFSHVAKLKPRMNSSTYLIQAPNNEKITYLSRRITIYIHYLSLHTTVITETIIQGYHGKQVSHFFSLKKVQTFFIYSIPFFNLFYS